MKLLPLSKGFSAQVDDSDWELISPYKWYVVEARDHKYAATYLPGDRNKRTYLHRFLMRPGPEEIVDHISGDGLDCTRANMRVGSVSQNAAWGKQQRRRKSKYRGVIWSKNRWQAKGQCLGKSKYLGRFMQEEEAARAWDVWAAEAHGAFARLNFPEERIAALEKENQELFEKAERYEHKCNELECVVEDLNTKLNQPNF